MAINVEILGNEEATELVEDGAIVTTRVIGGQSVRIMVTGAENVPLGAFLTAVLNDAPGVLPGQDVAAMVNGRVARDPDTELRHGDEVVVARQKTNG